MRRTLLAVVLLALAPAARADDTADFLNPSNWQGRTDLFRIEGGSLIGETTQDPKHNTFFCTKAKYSDFELSFRVQLRDGIGNSGIQVRSTLIDPKMYVVGGPQVDIGKGYWGSLYGERVGGMMKASDPKAIEAAVKPTEWNAYSIRVVGDHYTIKINGTTMVDADFPTLPGKKAEAAPKDGIIALQVHAGYPKMRVELKDIRFTKLGKK